MFTNIDNKTESMLEQPVSLLLTLVKNKLELEFLASFNYHVPKILDYYKVTC
jgi:hypothetical protein